MKITNSRTPEKFLEDTLMDFPRDSSNVLEGHAAKEDIPLVCICHKYNLEKMLVFISTKGDGSTQTGEPYFAKVPDKSSNVCTREAPWP